MTYNKKVIIFPLAPKVWGFFDFVDRGSNKIEEWVKDLSEDASDIFSRILKDNQKIDNPRSWLGLRTLKGKASDWKIWELRFHSGVQHRCLGVFGPGRKEATLLIGCYHKDDNYTPRDCIEIACKRARALSIGEATRHERKIRTNL